MPIRINADLPAKKILEHENIFVMDETRAIHQDLRPIKIGYSSIENHYHEPDAYQTGNGASAFKESF